MELGKKKDLADFGEEREDNVPNFNDVNRAKNAALGVARRFSRTRLVAKPAQAASRPTSAPFVNEKIG